MTLLTLFLYSLVIQEDWLVKTTAASYAEECEIPDF